MSAITVQDQFQPAQTLMPQSPAEAHYSLQRRKAVDFSKSTLVPKEYQGNPANVMIAMEIAHRIGASDLMVMQNLYIVHGRPSWSATFLIASVNASKRFTPLRFEVDGTDPANKSYRVRAYADDVKTGDKCVGAWITWAMVDGEKWGPKWKTLPEQMFMYRAASFWTRTYAPEVAMGIQTVEEVHDVWGTATMTPNAPTDHGNIKSLESQLLGHDTATPDPVLEIDASEIHRRLTEATTLDELHDAAADISLLEDEDDVVAMTSLYAKRGEELAA